MTFTPLHQQILNEIQLFVDFVSYSVGWDGLGIGSDGCLYWWRTEEENET